MTDSTAAWRNVYYVSMLTCTSLQGAFKSCPALVGKTFEDLIRRSEASTPEPEVGPTARLKRGMLPDLLLVDEGQMLYKFGFKVNILVEKKFLIRFRFGIIPLMSSPLVCSCPSGWFCQVFS